MEFLKTRFLKLKFLKTGRDIFEIYRMFFSVDTDVAEMRYASSGEIFFQCRWKKHTVGFQYLVIGLFVVLVITAIFHLCAFVSK